MNLEALFPIQKFAEYRAYARQGGYCDPFIPFVGRRYGEGLRLVYCGVAVRQTEQVNWVGSDEDLYQRERDFSEGIAADPMSRSAFWRFLDRLTSVVFGESEGWLERRQKIAWTNLSKLSRAENRTAPPDSDAVLRRLDAEQLSLEVDCLRPDLFVCVSGNSLIPTGRAVFEKWLPEELASSIEGVWIRRMPHGGSLYWADHPSRKPSEWSEQTFSELAKLVQELKGQLDAPR